MRKFLPALPLILLASLPANAQNKTVALKWTPGSGGTGTLAQTVFRETAQGACTPTSTGIGPGCIKLNATPLANTVNTFNDSVGGACTANSATCAVPGTYWYVVRVTDGTGQVAQAESNSVTVSLPLAAPASVSATVQ